MLVLQTLDLENYATFGKVSLSITPGVTYIYGLNRTSGKASKNRNGVGKSAMVGAIKEIVHEDPVIGERSDRTQGQKTLHFIDNKKRKIQISRIPKGRGEKIGLNVDGRDIQLRTPTIAKQAIRRVFPLSGEEYDTFVHIDSRIPHPLVMGNTAARQRFFTSFFGLDKIDAERKLYVAELSKLKRTRAAFDELRVQYEKTKENLLDEEQLARIKRIEAKLATEVGQLQDKISQMQNVLRLVEFAKNSKAEIEALKVACQGEITEEEFNRADKDNKLDYEDTKSKLEDAEAWEQHQRDNHTYVEAYSKISEKTQGLLVKYGRTKLTDRCNRATDELETVQANLKETQSRMDALKVRLVRDLPRKVEVPEVARDELEVLRRAYRHQLDHATKFKSGNCETCGQVVKVKDPKVLKQKLESVVEKLNLHTKAEQYSEAITERRKDKAEFADLKQTKESLLTSVDKLMPWVKVGRAIRDLPREPRPFKGKKLQVKVCKLMMEEILERRSLLKYMRPHLETVLEFMALTKEDLAKARNAAALQDQIVELQTKWTRAQTKIGVHERFSTQVKELRSRLKQLKAELEDEEALTHLVKAYQNKNLKKMAIEAISERLMVLVNRFAQQVMPEHFTFEFKWDTQIRLLVHRHHGKKVRTSDVRRLSGAESTFFTLVLVCALLAFVPDSKRTNVLILDEPAARLSDELKETFKNLIKILNTLIPSIIVITPHTEVHDGARSITVVKERNGMSKLVEAHPLTIK